MRATEGGLLPANDLYHSGGRNITPALRVFIDALRAGRG